jgi:ribonuclease T2
MTRGRIRLAVVIVVAICAALAAQARKTKHEAVAPPPAFDYYVLSLSWAPEFCAEAGAAAANPKECATGRGTGFVVHGLWPTAAQGQSPESCGPPQRVPKNVVRIAMPYMLSENLIQHEWAVHGTCTGLTPAAYFFDVIQARSAVQIPVQMISIEVPDTEQATRIEDYFAAVNAAFPRDAFRVVCPKGALAEVRVCFSRDLKPAECPLVVSECQSTTVNIRPIR